ncbi:GGDEF domain-containing protein [Aminobacter carboxidus]|uniref:GGDEF domain-containing protein n=1 Tax=Aminobacter carboxidus TaxID=376165 RepID=UPI003EBB68C9
MLDFGSLLLATALSGACLSGTLVAIWLTARQSRFVLTMAVGILLLVSHVIAFWLYGQYASPWLGQAMLSLLVAGFFVVFTSADQYIERGWSGPATMPIAAIIALTVVVTAAGYDGLGFVIAYSTVTGILIMIATAFWTSKNVDRRVLAPVSLLTGSSAVSFALCAFVIVQQKQWVLGGVPRNWAEDVNTVVVVACMTALGALTISFHHLRTQSRLTEETLTDPLTGLMNRRALSSLHDGTRFGPGMALAMVDLDHFKRTNDVFGHAVGDRVLQRFADVVRRQYRHGVEGFRLGGEEFAIVGNECAGGLRDTPQDRRVLWRRGRRYQAWPTEEHRQRRCLFRRRRGEKPGATAARRRRSSLCSQAGRPQSRRHSRDRRQRGIPRARAAVCLTAAACCRRRGIQAFESSV